jgi:vancomycin resistance protein YoaR
MSKKSENLIDKEHIETTEKSNKTTEIKDIEIENINIEANHEKIENPNIENIHNEKFDHSFDNKKNLGSTTQKSYFILLFLIISCLLILFSVFSTVFALLNIGSNRIICGISVNGINISGLTSKEAIQKLSYEFSKQLDTPLTLTYKDYSTTLIPRQEIDATYDINYAIEAAYSIGRSDNIFKNNFEIFFTYITHKNIDLDLKHNQEKLDYIVNNIGLELPGILEQPSYYIENNELRILTGKEGIKLLQNETKNLILSAIESKSSSYSISIPVNNVEPDKIDINKIHSEVHTEPQNAYINHEPFELFLGSPGTDFAITIEEAKHLLSEEKSEYIIPLKITEAEIGPEDLGDSIFIDTISTYTSKYDVSNRNRSTNVELAASKLNNIILLPGETFSYNKTVGKRTINNGFKEASIYTKNGIEYGLGGGICQVSSTLYNAVLEANLDIVERKNHSYSVSYVPLGRDATVSYGTIDFKFKNSRSYPIKLVSSAKNGIVSISIKGIKEETEYTVTITTKKLQTTPFETKYINDNTLTKDSQVVKQNGFYGYKYESYKVLSLNGAVVSTTLLSTDNYIPLPKIVRVGTKEN